MRVGSRVFPIGVLILIFGWTLTAAGQSSPLGQIYDTGGWRSESVAVADVNGDGKPDLLIASTCPEGQNCGPTAGIVSVLLGNGDGTFQAVKTFSTGGEGADSIAVADFNGDGKLDVAVANLSGASTGNVGVLLGNGDGTFAPVVTYDIANYAAPVLTLFDMNGDGKLDIVVGTYAYNGAGAFNVLLGNGDGTFQAASPHYTGYEYTYSLAIGDVNGDGTPDIFALTGTGAIVLNPTCPFVNAPPECVNRNYEYGQGIYQNDYPSSNPQGDRTR